MIRQHANLALGARIIGTRSIHCGSEPTREGFELVFGIEGVELIDSITRRVIMKLSFKGFLVQNRARSIAERGPSTGIARRRGHDPRLDGGRTTCGYGKRRRRFC